ncbi:amino acid adenylation domain-containing protein [Streptomyces inhibens]|uniref:Amino acid adenylation domain-containing protein n=1 Tax=Streptomyces inhibens TaxID=2293571 RepID=A0A371PYV6_STRIH|nr:non-ribosomal peptide synthetase [Streptomyces inhibens]REK87676.1 amino acid adenylation domain-containing protein [Streptomyces inhibens]
MTKPARPADPEQPWRDCSVAGPTVEFDQEARIEDLLRQQVLRDPDRTAVVGPDFSGPDSSTGPDSAGPGSSLSYAELDRRSNRLARTLRAHGAGPGRPVAVAVERSCEMLVAVLATLKAGAAYVPVDLSYPEARIAYLLADSRAELVLARPGSPARVPEHCTVLDPYAPASYADDDSPVDRLGRSTDLAYVIYTSGSTGHPKGVMVEHRSVVNRLSWMQREYPLSAADVILQKTPIAFDVSVWELFWWMRAGARVHLLEPGGEKNPDRIMSAVERHGVTVLHFVPSMLNAFLEYAQATGQHRRLGGLRQVFASGEALTSHHVRRFHAVFGPLGGTELVNLYGPTEATVDVTHHRCADPDPARVPIGRPIDNTRLYVLDERLRPTPPGASGELCIAGVGLARGYLRREQLTAERFVADPFPGEDRVYRTGDLVRLRPDGAIEYLGRNDHQVKISGVRIELGEVEEALLRHPAVTGAVVVARSAPGGDPQLCAYVQSRTAVAAGELRRHLAQIVPAAMVPAHLVRLAAFPLTSNGKLDRAALPLPADADAARPAGTTPGEEAADHTGGHAARAPRWAERTIAAAWAKVLGVPAEQIRAEDNFFDLGGTSLGVLKVATELSGLLTLEDLMRQSDLGPLAETLRQARTTGHGVH